MSVTAPPGTAKVAGVLRESYLGISLNNVFMNRHIVGANQSFGHRGRCLSLTVQSTEFRGGDMGVKP